MMRTVQRTARSALPPQAHVPRAALVAPVTTLALRLKYATSGAGTDAPTAADATETEESRSASAATLPAIGASWGVKGQHPDGALAKSQVAQLSHTMGFAKPQYKVLSFDPSSGYRVSLTLESGETYFSGVHMNRKAAEYEAAGIALREAKCFQVVSVPVEEQRTFPTIEFKGRVTLVKDVTTAYQAVTAFRSTLTHFPVIGVDTESQPHFYRPKPDPELSVTTSSATVPPLPDVLQVASEDHAIVFLMRQLKTLPEPLVELLADASVMKIGAGVVQDAALLRRYHPRVQPHSFVDLSSFARTFLAYPHGLRSLTGIFLRSWLSKRHQTSNWGSHTLSPAQLKYAATDAWVSVAIYRAMCQQDEHTSHTRIRAVLDKAGFVPHERYLPTSRSRS